MPDALNIEKLCKVYDNGLEALSNVSLSVEEGDFFALIGPNGAGKSTTIGVISSLVRKTSGTVKIFGNDIVQESYRARRLLGVMPQEFNFNPFDKVFDIIVTQAGYYGVGVREARSRATELLKQLDLWDMQQQQAQKLSGGMKRRLLIARALVSKPRLLILDEPTAGVDIELRRFLWDYLRQINREGVTVILTTHYFEEAEHLCRNIAVINRGRLIQSSSIRALLQQLQQEQFLLDLAKPIKNLPQIKGFDVNLVDPMCLEVAINRGQTLNTFYQLLSDEGVEILSMRNKVSRLEEVFMDLVEDDHVLPDASEQAANLKVKAAR